MKNSLAEKHPELVAEWSERNLPLTPMQISYGSKKLVWWKGSCGHEWKTSVKARSAGERCPICAGVRIVPGINDLATRYPEIAAEWSERNRPLDPQKVSAGSHKKAYWRCRKGHEWSATIKSRTEGGNGLRKMEDCCRKMLTSDLPRMSGGNAAPVGTNTKP